MKAIKNLRIAQINCRPKYFTSVIYNEGELMEKFGIEVVPINIAVVEQTTNRLIESQSVKINNIVEDIKSRVDCSQMDSDALIKIAALKLSMMELAEIHKCSAVATECWTVMPLSLGVLPCFAMAELTDTGLPVACETDVNGAITSILLTAAARGKSPSFFGEFTMRHPENDNGELLWHCGSFPHSLRKQNAQPKLVGGRPDWEIKGGDITIARFDGDRGSYKLFVGQGKGIDGPKTTGTYVWLEVDNWVKWERKLIEGPYIHHASGIHGHYAESLKEACKYIPDLSL